MRRLLRELPLRKILIASIILGSMIGTISTFAYDEINTEGLTCYGDSNHPNCTWDGCHNSRPDGRGYIVCLYNEAGCPPATACS